jgi:hypothetical protein
MLMWPADGEKHPEEELDYDVSIRGQNHIVTPEQVGKKADVMVKAIVISKGYELDSLLAKAKDSVM